MSLAEQSQQWFPTSVQVTVHQARNLRAKGKNGTNDSYAIIQVAKDKFSTSVAEKSVAPVWKEEASFDLPLFHPGNAERCTLYITVMHRAQVGLDKFLGQAVINLLNLHDKKDRKKTDWFKLVDKTGKEDKERGEVLLDIQFMRNNMSASMFDLSMQDKPRSRISKIKDKVRGKKKEGLSDSASAIVSPVSQVLTDSEGEADAQSLSQSPGVKKKSKIKSLFAPKSNLHRNISQSMSTLGTLPEKNSSLSGSRSSGLNVDTPEVKKKFKFLGHKRTGSSDSKVSQGPFSLLGRSKQTNSDVNSLCINGSHVYTEESEPKTGSTLSLNSSGPGSVEDVYKHTSDVSAVSSISVPHPTYRNESTDRTTVEQQRHQEEERRLAEEKRMAEAKRVEEEEKHRAALKRLQEEEEHKYQEEQERKRRFLEDEARRKRQEEEEEERRRQEEKLQAAEKQRLEEEQRKLEEQKRQEEASMTDRLSTLFGIIRKKEEKKEEVQQHPKEERPTPAPQLDSRNLDQPKPHQSTNPFEEIPLSSEPTVGSSESLADQQISSVGPQIPSAAVFLSRTTKVSAVKPRLNQSLEFEPPECQTLSQLCPSSATSPESTLCSVPSESPDTFSSLHFSLAPPSPSLSSSPFGSTENLSSLESVGSSPTMAEKKRKALLPPRYPVQGNQTGGNHVPELNHTHMEAEGTKQGKKMSLPLPDYETLFPQKRHGVQGHTKWDHIIAEVHQKHRDGVPELVGPEMSVDGPGERKPSPWSSISQESSATRETKPVSSKKVAAPAPPKAVTSPHPQTQPETIQRQNQTTAHQSAMKHNTPAVEAPTAKPRQRVIGKEPSEQEDSAVTPDEIKNSKTQTLLNQSMRSMDKKGERANKNFTGFDPFPSSELLSQDPWAIQEDDELFTGNTQIEQKPENQGMTPDDLDKIFSQEKPPDPFASFNSSESNKRSEHDTVDAGFHIFQRKNSQRQKQAPSKSQSDDKALKSQQEPAYKEVTPKTEPNQRLKTSDVRKESVKADVKTQRSFYSGEDQFGAELFTVPSVLTSSEPLPVVMEEPAEGLSGGKTVLQAWVSPSEAQPVSAQSSTGGGQAFTPRRPHPVKPLTTAESQHDIKLWDSTPGKIKVAGSSQSGPYTQLTQEELITLVVKQQTDLSKKDAKIVELEEYIDNLLLRVIEEKPSILQALSPPKRV